MIKTNRIYERNAMSFCVTHHTLFCLSRGEKVFLPYKYLLNFLILKDPKVECEIIDCSVNSWWFLQVCQNMRSSKFAGSLGIHLCKLMLGGDRQLGRIPSATVLFLQAGERVMMNRPFLFGFYLTFFFPRRSWKKSSKVIKLLPLRTTKVIKPTQSNVFFIKCSSQLIKTRFLSVTV